jgi:hypothetical protein
VASGHRLWHSNFLRILGSLLGLSERSVRQIASNHTCPGVRKYPGRERERKEGVLSRVKRIVAVFATSALLVGAVSSTALAVNDPLVPGDNCAPDNAQAVGHPALANNQTPETAANPPFSSNNPGVSTGAQGSEHSQASCDA